MIAGGHRTRRPVVGASVDLGANSVHLLVAVVGGHRLQPLVDESVFLGLGAAVDDSHRLGPAATGELVAALVRYAETARRLGAEAITFLGTDPIRHAADAARIVVEVERASGVPLHVISHQEEALLTLIGVMEGRPVRHETLVVDVGGGSSEFVVVAPGRPAVAAGLQLGSARLTGQHVASDPPAMAEIEAMRESAGVIVRGALDASPQEIVAVGGTASNLCKILPAAILDRTLTHRRIADAIGILATEPSALAAERHLVNPIRARILPAGAMIMDAILDRYGLDRIRVSEAGVREGSILVVNHAGAAWRDRLDALAHGWPS